MPTERAQPAAGPSSALTSVSVPVAGMTCAACARVIERTLTRLPGVDAAAVNYATGRASLRFDPVVVGTPGHCRSRARCRLRGRRSATRGRVRLRRGDRRRSAPGGGARVPGPQAPLHDRARLRRAARRHRHVARAVPGRELGPARAGGVRALRRRRPVLSRCVGSSPTPQRRHEHAHCSRHRVGICVLARGDRRTRAGCHAACIGTRRHGARRVPTRWRPQSSSSCCSAGFWSRGRARARRTPFAGSSGFSRATPASSATASSSPCPSPGS